MKLKQRDYYFARPRAASAAAGTEAAAADVFLRFERALKSAICHGRSCSDSAKVAAISASAQVHQTNVADCNDGGTRQGERALSQTPLDDSKQT